MLDQSPRQFINDRLGGATKVGALLGLKPGSVRMWVLRNRIPRTVWPDLLDAYPTLTLDELRALESADA